MRAVAMLAVLALALLPLAGCVQPQPQEAVGPQDDDDVRAPARDGDENDQGQDQDQGQGQEQGQGQGVVVIVNNTNTINNTVTVGGEGDDDAPPQETPRQGDVRFCETRESMVRHDCWPREGSFARWNVTVTDDWDGGDKLARATAAWTFRDGDWHGECTGWYEIREDDGDVERVEFRETYEAGEGAHWPLFNDRIVTVGEITEGWHLWECDIRHDDLLVREDGTATARVDGQTTTVVVHRGAYDRGEESHRATWDPNTGLVYTWQFAHGDEVTTGQLLETDAPIRTAR